LQRGSAVAPAPNQHVEDLTLVIDGTPIRNLRAIAPKPAISSLRKDLKEAKALLDELGRLSQPKLSG
jgi:hypothetical protein